MPTLDLEQLLTDVSPDAPSGDDLEYDPAFIEFEQAAEGKPEQQYGDTIVPAEPPDYKTLARLGRQLAARTKDLRVGTHLARALLAEEGLGGFRDAISLLCGYVEKFWPSLHPQLDPDDDNDPTIRVNTLGSLNDIASTLRLLKQAPLVSIRMMGNVSWMDFAIARGEMHAPDPNEPVLKQSDIDAMFNNVELSSLQDTAEAIQQSIDKSKAIEDFVLKQVGAAEYVSLKPLNDTLASLKEKVAPYLAAREDSQQAPEQEASAAAAEEEAAQTAATGDSTAGPTAGTAASPTPAKLSGEITCRDDVIRALEKIEKYYANYEPSSPLPLLLHRAKRLAKMSFLEIIGELAPDAVAQLKAVGGASSQAALLESPAPDAPPPAASVPPPKAAPSAPLPDPFA